MSDAARAAQARPAPRRRTARLVVLAVVGAAVAVFGVELVVSNFDEVLGAADLISRPQLGWLAIAVAAEVASYVTYAEAQRRLLVVQGRSIGLTRLSLLAVAAQAIGVLLPGGYAWSNVLSFRVLRRWGVDEVASGLILVVTAALYVAALALLGLIGAQVAGGGGPAADVRAVTLVVLGLVGLALVGARLRRRQTRRRALTTMSALERRLARRPAVAATLERLASGIRDMRTLGRRPLIWASAWLMAAWLADIGCLIAAFAAVGASPPWRGLLLAYCGGQLAALLPFTPGGLGVVEGSLTLALVSYGGGQERTLAAVLLYRLISFWGLLPTGAACYAAIGPRRRARAAAT